MLCSQVAQEKYSPVILWSGLTKGCTSTNLSSHLAQWLFSTSRYTIAKNHQCVRSCSVSVLTWPNVSSPCSPLEHCHCQGCASPAAKRLIQSFSVPLPPSPQRWGHLCQLSVGQWETWLFYQWIMNTLILSSFSCEKHIWRACCSV